MENGCTFRRMTVNQAFETEHLGASEMLWIRVSSQGSTQMIILSVQLKLNAVAERTQASEITHLDAFTFQQKPDPN